jgi:hypothetical protein
MPHTRYTWLEKARLAEIDAEEAQSNYLRLTGWQSTCKVPGAFWVWTKTLKDGRRLMGGTDLAVSIQQNIDDEEEPRPELTDCDGHDSYE